MKKRQFPLITIAILSLVILIQFCCTKDSSGVYISQTSPAKNGAAGAVQANAAPGTAATDNCQCGKTVSGSFTTLNAYHRYIDTIDLYA